MRRWELPAPRRASVVQWCSELYDRLLAFGGNLLLFGLYIAAMVGGGWALGGAWARAWLATPPGAVRMTAAAVADAVPGLGGAGTVLALLFGLLAGMVATVLLDPYKRIEGLAAVAGVVAAGASIMTSVPGPVALSASVLVGSGFGAVLGVLATGIVGANADTGVASLRGRLRRTGLVATLLAVVGVAEANLRGGSAIAAPGSAVTTSAGVDGATTAVEVAAVLVLVVVLWRLLRYRTARDVLILGPQRSGKTWLIGGLAHSLKKRAAERPVGAPTVLNEPLEGEDGLYRKFRNEEFDDIGSTEPGEAAVHEIRFQNGWIFRRQTTVRLLDYAGEHYRKLNPNTLSDVGSLPDTPTPRGDPGVVPELTAYVNDQDAVDRDELIAIMTVMLHHASAVGLVLPMDDFVDDMEYPDDFPGHIDRDVDLNKIRSDSYTLKHGDVLAEYGSEKNVFLLATMSDILYESFRRDPRFGRTPRADPPGFRRFVFQTLVDTHDLEHLGGQFKVDTRGRVDRGPLRRIVSENPVVPVYLHPKETEPHEPKLNPGHRGYPLFGLRSLLRRIRR